MKQNNNLTQNFPIQTMMPLIKASARTSKNRSRPRQGFTLVEIMVVVALLSFLIASTYNAFLAGQSIWLKTETTIELKETLMKAQNRIAPELRQSGHSAISVLQLWISDNEGVYKSDVFRFSIPVSCQLNTNIINAQGDTAFWGAPLTWGCTDSSCMDANNSCETLEYKFIQYLLVDQNRLVRRVLDFNLNTLREDPIAENIIDLQIELDPDQKLALLRITAEKKLTAKNTIRETLESKIYLRNTHN